MSQTYTDNCFTTTGVVQTQMGQVEENFAALKSAFSGATTPANTVAGMWWFDTTANILKLRNEANSAWLSVWDFANNKPILANNIIGDFAAALKDPAAGTAGFRTIGTTAVKACAGNDARLSDTRTPTDASVTSAKLIAPTAGSVLSGSNDTEYSTPLESYTEIKRFTFLQDGAYRFTFDLRISTIPGTAYGRIYRNGVAVGTEQSNATASYITKNEDISGWSAGDLCSLYVKSSSSPKNVYARNFRVYVDALCLPILKTAF